MTTISTFAVKKGNDGKFTAENASVSVEFRSGLGIHIVGLRDFPAREILLRTVTALSACGCLVGNKKITVDIDLGTAILRDRENIMTELFDFPLAVAIMNELGFAKFDTSMWLRYVGMLRPDGRIELLGDSVYEACNRRVFKDEELISANTIWKAANVDPGHVYLSTFRRVYNLNAAENAEQK